MHQRIVMQRSSWCAWRDELAGVALLDLW